MVTYLDPWQFFQFSDGVQGHRVQVAMNGPRGVSTSVLNCRILPRLVSHEDGVAFDRFAVKQAIDEQHESMTVSEGDVQGSVAQ